MKCVCNASLFAFAPVGKKGGDCIDFLPFPSLACKSWNRSFTPCRSWCRSEKHKNSQKGSQHGTLVMIFDVISCWYRSWRLQNIFRRFCACTSSISEMKCFFFSSRWSIYITKGRRDGSSRSDGRKIVNFVNEWIFHFHLHKGPVWTIWEWGCELLLTLHGPTVFF